MNRLMPVLANIKVNVLGVGVHAVNMHSAVTILKSHIDTNGKGYVCLTGVHGIMEVQRDPGLKSIFSEALLVAPDGMPTVWMGHLQGFNTMERVFGPDLMLEIIGRNEFRDCVHFFCGGAPGVAESLREVMTRRFPWVKIAGTYAPPFRKMTVEEESELSTQIRLLRPDIIWVGLSTPKQEMFMARYLPMLDTKLMIGVGAAFLFHTGAIRDSPAWVKRAGLQWVHRFIQEPGRLWKRYLLNNPLFIFLVLLQFGGLKRYRLNSKSENTRSYVYESQ
ncbi:WecB/TagA/CpsF family glycosyltransferase [Tunturiibacter lichenicola]|uniref:WecB/TagA/CpsF family glycosyltransferase n=1 Tax=Tunturiibacter lichenicola TaxID=2051959 RepID=UPI0021B44698|nr:WecB/TagA/CpsF family glycosyltransferase [Edaphobacter lichenicola]